MNDVDKAEQARRELFLKTAAVLEAFVRHGLTADRPTASAVTHAALLLRSLELHMASGRARTGPFRYDSAFDREGRVDEVRDGTVVSLLLDPADPDMPEHCEFPLDLVPEYDRPHFVPGALFRMTVGTAVHYLRKAP